MMKPFKRLFRRSKSKKVEKETSDSDTCITTATDNRNSPVETAEDQNWKSELAQAFLAKWNEHDMEGAGKMVTAEYVFVFADNQEMEYDDMARETTNVFNAFPDFYFQYDSIKQRESDGVVVVSNLVASGHHTAKPYAFGPCPPIQPSGKYIQNSPETLYFHFRDGKICKLIVDAEGEMTGPPGIYTQLGGFPCM
ncbi:expressed unknown protein [Seminavis robusta]|uniref:Uncharacterized protein n=1 Tax=Seminavis robusta TaxID=568900 RepID=A0A9N8HXG9_9STRA|nr:expressed unknown protein [Seminavis robusta]|eukprot:Sro2495_g329280.1 n/a (195) ;mRNA; f:8785-9369